MKVNRIKKLIFKIFILGLFLGQIVACKPKSKNIPDQSFNSDWLFQKGDPENAESIEFDDSSWRILDLPHDWAIEGPFQKGSDLRTGGLPVAGTAWYRKHFNVEQTREGKQVSVEFDGAMNNAKVWVNGEFIGERPYGYMGFEFDITPFVKFGGENVIAVRLNPEDIAARWYPGAGIYRNVRIKYNNSVHIPQWGTFITTPIVTNELAKVNVITEIKNAGEIEKKGILQTRIQNNEGLVVGEITSDFKIANQSFSKIEQNIEISNPKLWDLETPDLYIAISEVIIDGNVLDKYETEFGIRTIEFTVNDGFLLNGKRVQFNGVCMHHDLGPLGSAVNYRARERQMEIMKSMGVNALRTSHNPPEPEWLQICDRLGILVQVEAFDEWQIGKVENGYNKYFDQWHEKDLRDMIRRDRNHPSVIMWSIGNEILEQGQKDGWKLAKHLNDICHDEDITRPTTAGFNYYPAPFSNRLAFQIDVVGLNYWPLQYKEVKEKYPDLVVYGSETSSQTSSRGVYHLPIEATERHETNQVSSYDAIVGPPWAYPPDVEFDALEAEPASLGEFIWTGFDYLGEPTPYAGRDNSTNGRWTLDWPSRSSYFAPVDLAGFPKDRYYLYQSQWTTEPMVHLLPHWNWEGMEGEIIPVFVYTNCDEAELFLNGRSLGKRIKGKDFTLIPAEFHYFEFGEYKTKYRLSWDVPFEAGELKVLAYKDGKPVVDKVIKTAGEPAQILLHADRNTINADGLDLSFITVTILDENGNVCPKASNLVEFNVEGEGKLLALENGDPTATTSYQASERVVFNSLCLAILKSTNQSGTITLKATSDGLKSSEISIKTE